MFFSTLAYDVSNKTLEMMYTYPTAPAYVTTPFKCSYRYNSLWQIPWTRPSCPSRAVSVNLNDKSAVKMWFDFSVGMKTMSRQFIRLILFGFFLREIDITQYRMCLVNSIVVQNDLQFNPMCLEMSSPVGSDFEPVCTHTKLQWLTCDVVKLKKHERCMSRSQDSVP